MDRRLDCQKCGKKEGAIILVYGKYVCGECYLKVENKINNMVWG